MYQLIVIILLLNYQHKYTVLANVSYGSSSKEWNLLTIIENNFNVGLSTTDSDFVLNLTAKDHDFYFPAQSIFPDMIIKEDVFFYVKFHPKSTSFTILTIRDAYNTMRLGIRVFEKRGQFIQYRLNVFYNPIPQGKINYQNETELTIPFSNSTWTLGVLLENRKITIYTKCEDIKRPFGYHQSKDTAPTNEKFFNGGATLFLFNNGDNAGHKEKFEGTVSDLLLTDKSQINELMCIEETEGSGMTPKKWKPKNIGNYLITEESTTKGLETTSSTSKNADSTLSTLTKQRIVSKKRKSRKPRPIKRKSTTKTKKQKKKRYSQTKNQTTTTATISQIKDILISKSSNDTVIPTTLDKKLISTISESIIRTVNQIQTLSNTVSQSSSTTLTSNPTNVPTTFTTSNLTKTPNNPKTVATNPTTTKTPTLTTTPTNPTTTLTNSTTPTNPTTTLTNSTTTPKNPTIPTTTTTPALTTTKMTTLTTTPTSTQTTTPLTTTITTSTTQSTIPSTSQSPLWSTTSQTTLSTKIPTISTILNKNAKSVKSAYSTVSIFSLDNTKGEKGEKGEHGSPGQTSSECSCLEYLRLNIPGKGTTGPKGETGERGEKGNPGIPGRNGVCESNQCKFTIPSKGLKGDRGENGFCSAELCKRSVISNKGNKGDKGEIGSQGIKGERGNNLKISDILSIILPEVKSTIDDFLNKNIMNLKGEPGSCLCKTNVIKEDKIKTQSIVLNDAKKLKSLSFNMPVGQIVFLIVENILLVKIDELKNRWRPVKLENPESDWYFASDTQNYQSIPQTTVLISQIFNTAFKLMLIALPNPTGGDLRSDPLEPGAYSGSSYLCQKQAYNYGLGRAFYPLLNTDMFDFTYLLPEKYRYGVPVVNRRNEKIANSYVDLLKQTVEMQASILDFRGDSIMSDTNYPCIWIGVKPTLHEDKSPTEDGLCLNWMSKSPNDTALVTELKLDKPLLDPVQIKYKSCNNICYILCMQIYPLMSEVRKL